MYQNFKDKDVWNSFIKTKESVLIPIRINNLIDCQDDEGMTVIYFSESELESILHSNESNIGATNTRLVNAYSDYIYCNDNKITVLLNVEILASLKSTNNKATLSIGLDKVDEMYQFLRTERKRVINNLAFNSLSGFIS
jgi:hypothetical protein